MQSQVLGLKQYAKNNKYILIPMIGKAAYSHDMGKLMDGNQQVLSGIKKEKKLPINHVDAGVAYLLDEKHFSVHAAALVYAHHGGFPDFPLEMSKEEFIFRDTKILFYFKRFLNDVL